MVPPAPPLFDTHLHLDFWEPALADSLLARARRAGVGLFLVPGVERGAWGRLLELARTHRDVLAAPGLHPQAAGQWDEGTERELEALLGEEGVVAVGEIGLDGSPGYPPAAVQERALRGQLRLAATADLPVLIHCRRATGRLFEILREERAGRIGGIFHAFSGSPETARQAMDLGFALGFGGPLTYPNARQGPQTLEGLAREWIVLETDAPDLPPHPHRDAENRPELLPVIARRVGAIRGWEEAETARVTTANARRILGLAREGGKDPEKEPVE